MGQSLNKLSLIGNVGAAPEVRTLSGGTKLATLSLATKQRWKDKSGQYQERTDWHRLKCWDRLAEVVEEYVSAGDRLYVEGRVEYGSYDRDGVTISTVEVHVRELLMLGGRRYDARCDDDDDMEL